MLNARSREDSRCWEGSRDGGGGWHPVAGWGSAAPRPPAPPPRPGPRQPCLFAQVLSVLSSDRPGSPPGNRGVRREVGGKNPNYAPAAPCSHGPVRVSPAARVQWPGPPGETLGVSWEGGTKG